MSGTFASLGHRNYRVFFVGAVVSNVGTWMQRVAQDWLVFELTGSATAVGITTGLQFLPVLVLGLYGGVLADRYPKRRLLVVTQTALGVQALVLGVLALTGVAAAWHVYLLALLMGCVTVVDNPTRQAFVSELVGPADLMNAVALNSASFNAARLVGPAVAGVLITLVGSGWVIMINAVSFAAVIASVLLLRPELLHPSPPVARAPGQVREGLAYVRSRPDLVVVLAVVFFVGTFGLNFQLTLTVFAGDVFGRGADAYGYLSSALAVGTLVGALLAARRGRPRERIVLEGAAVFGVLVLVAAAMPTYELFMASLVPVGVASLTFITAANATVQLSVEPAVRGRVMALYGVVFLGGTPVGAPLLGLLAESAGPRWSLAVGGLVSLLAPLVGVVVLARRRHLVFHPHLTTWPPEIEVTAPPEEASREVLAGHLHEHPHGAAAPRSRPAA